MSASLKRVDREGFSPSHALIERLHALGLPIRYRLNSKQQLINFIITNPMAIIRTSHLAHFLVIDSTYKTNRFRMPMLHFISSAPRNQTFTVVAAFLRSEDTENYLWALTLLKDWLGPHGLAHVKFVVTDQEMALINACTLILPDARQLRCWWHIYKNIAAKHKSQMNQLEWKAAEEDWRAVVTATLLEAYNNAVDALEQNWSAPQHLEFVRYCLSKLDNHQFFAEACVGKDAHFGEVNSSQVVSQHAAVKARIQSSTGDLYTVVERIALHMQQSQQAILDTMAVQHTRAVTG